MKLLLDTHIFLWYIARDKRLPVAYEVAIRDPGNAVFVSVASIWEAVIKHGRRKLTLSKPPEILLPEHRANHKFASLQIDESVLPFVASLPPIHHDPFDRMLVAQALQLGLTMLTVDDAIKKYSVPVLPE